ncbi:MAG: GAF domain-containing protein [Chloroflexi bacterium]|nr:GAF domain-containing protein [Chloroflexota bacterium]
MAIADTSPTSDNTALNFQATIARLSTTIVFCVLLFVAGMYIVSPYFAWRWMQIPFMGIFVEPTLIFSGASSPSGERWAVSAAGLTYPDRLIAIDDHLVTSPDDVNQTLAKYSVGDTVLITYEKASGSSLGPWTIQEQASLRVPLSRFSFQSQLNYFLLPYLIGLTFLIIGTWVFYVRRNENAGRAFAMFCASMAVLIGGLFDLYTTKVFIIAWTFFVPMIGGSAFSLGLIFPQETRFINKRPYLSLLGYAPALVLIVAGEWMLNVPRAYAAGWLVSYLYAALGGVFLILMNMYRWGQAASPIVRSQSRIIVAASALGFTPIIFWLVYSNAFDTTFQFNVLYHFTPLIAFPLGIAYAILRYRLLKTEYILSRGLIYTSLIVLTVVGYGLIVTGISTVLGSMLPGNSPALIAILVLILIFGLNPLRLWLENKVDAFFFRSRLGYRQQLQQFSRVLTESVDLPLIANEIQRLLDNALKPEHLYIFLRDHSRVEYQAYAANGQSSTDIRFNAESSLARSLTSRRNVLHLAPDTPLPSTLLRDRSRLAVLGSTIFVPLNSKNGLIGWLALGNKLSGQPYSSQDLDFLESLTDQSALAIERAQAVATLEKRLNELNVLSQVSQAINFSVSFDDLLELVYAQTGRVLDVSNFSIVLHQPRARKLSYALHVENNERIPSLERTAWDYGEGLVSEIVRSGQPILTDDYLGECARRRVAPLARPYQAWMGVPLNVGAGTLGALVISSFDVGRTFSDDHLKIFTAIADQAATAIDKARLYQQTEQRARQLATLNQVAQTITSTLDLEPLLQQVLESAVNILACEAGSLFLLDEETGESIFKNTVGPVARNLIGSRVPAGRGIVGETAKSGQPIIVNDTAHDPRWFYQSDQTTGFLSRAVLAVPLRIKDRTIGVIEVINKRDGSPFDEEDTTLLTAFGGQAAVAIENARLFNSTDQALAARVEELSVMQRIDRELNAALDVKRIFSYVLDRALALTGADAALAGIVLEEGFEIVAHRGYGDAIKPFIENAAPLGKGLIGRALATGRVSLTENVKSESDYIEVLPSAVAQLIIPMRREDQTLGVVAIESRNPDCFSDENVEFLVRLADHAAISLANARLYAEVNAANLAKSEFVSFVSHELKTPMTSIKGYADWLSAGAVGPLNETQGQFLNIIKSNVERMTTIVSDLADVARIESGRLKLETKEMSFQTVIDEVVRSLQGQYDAKQQTLLMDVESDLPLVWGDHVRLVQALTNLMSNGYKYTPVGGSVTLRVHRAKNIWDAKGAAEVLHVSVQDTGYGISPVDQKKIFTKFFRAEDRSIREAPGTGLGLNIFKQLIELSGGRTWFESELEKGSTFHFTVPVASAIKVSGQEAASPS